MTDQTTPEIPRLIDVAPNLAALHDQRAELGSEDSKLFQELLQIAEVQRGELDSPVATPTAGAAHRSRLARILGGVAETEPVVVDRKAEIQQRRRVIAKMIEEIDIATDYERRAASAKIMLQVAAVNRDRVVAVCRALLQVHHAQAQLHALDDALNADGVVGRNLYETHPNFLGWPTDRNGPLAVYLHEMKRAGHITLKDIPEPLR